MNLFSPERPTIANGNPALLLSKMIVPSIMVFPASPCSVELSVMLKEQKSGEQFSFRWHHVTIDLACLSEFFSQYIASPEETLLRYFSWEDKIWSKVPQAPTHNPLANLA